MPVFELNELEMFKSILLSLDIILSWFRVSPLLMLELRTLSISKAWLFICFWKLSIDGCSFSFNITYLGVSLLGFGVIWVVYR